MSSRSVVEIAVRSALQYLERASDSWHNGAAPGEGPLHWPLAIREAKGALRAALEVLDESEEPQQPSRRVLERPERAIPRQSLGATAATEESRS